MRKILTLLFIAMTVIAVRATDYNVPITVTVNGVMSEQTGVITIVENNGLYDLTLKNFMLQTVSGPMGVGNVEIRGIQPRQNGSATLLITEDQVQITDGDDPNVTGWLASSLPPVNVLLRGKVEGDHLRCYLDIDMTESLRQVIQVAIGEGWQMPNPGFELWHTSSGTHVEPNGWHSFESSTGGLGSLAGHHLTKSNKAHSGESCARIYSSSFFGIVANGTMTTGRLNAGSATAADLVNNAYLDMSLTDVDGNGDPFYIPLYGHPDSVAVWVKFRQGSVNSEHPYATISAIITDGTYYQDPEDKAYTNVVAKAKNDKIATTGGEWVRVTAPFVYTENAVEPQAVLVTISTNADPGQGSDGDEVLVDDIEFIYNAKVTGLKIKGHDVPDFDPELMLYEMKLDEEITADDIEVIVEGSTAHVIKEVGVDDGDYLCSVVVISADMSVLSSYGIIVRNSASAIRSLQTATSRSATYFTLDGRQAKTLQPGRIYICRQADGTVTKIRL